MVAAAWAAAHESDMVHESATISMTTDGKMSDLSLLAHAGKAVTGITDTEILDPWGNVFPAAPNIGADQGAAPGYGPWTTCDSSIPTDGQVFKSHALPMMVESIRAESPSGTALLTFNAGSGFTDTTGNHDAVLTGAQWPGVIRVAALNVDGKEWGFDLSSGAVRTAFLAGEATIVMQVTMPVMSSLTDATDYSLWGDVLFVRRDGTSGSFKLSDGTNTATVAYDWDEGEAVRVCVQCDGSRMCITNIRSVSTYPQTTLAQRTVRNLIKNSELSGTGTTPTGWTLYVNGGTCEIIPSSVWIGENAISASATWARVNLGYTLP